MTSAPTGEGGGEGEGPMRPEPHWSQVEAVAAGTATRLAERTLTVDVDGLRSAIRSCFSLDTGPGLEY
jgi:hypothetical protein